jgi:hypothetical protein
MLFEPDVSPFRPGSFAAGYDAAGGTSEARMDGIIGIFVLMYFRR